MNTASADPAAPVEIIRVTGPGYDDATREFIAGDEAAPVGGFPVDLIDLYNEVLTGAAESIEVRFRTIAGECRDLVIHTAPTPLGMQVVIENGGE